MIAVIVVIVGCLLAMLAIRWSSMWIAGGAEAALVATLVAVSAAFDIAVPVPNVELTTAVTCMVAMTLGVRAAITVGSASILGADLLTGFGPWTAWQIIGYVLVAGIAWLVATIARRTSANADATSPPSRTTALVAVVLATIAYDAVVSVSALVFIGPSIGVQGLLAAGLGFTLLHVAGNVVVMTLAGPPLCQTLSRARTKLSPHVQQNDVARG